MGTVGTFETFTTARLGIYAAQKGLSVTGNNIANLNTVGYTRQRLDQISFKTGGNDRYRSMFDNHVGSGALITGINQIRDPYLDIRYRDTAAKVGYNDTKLAGLKEIAETLDEVGKGGKTEETKGDGLLVAQLQELADALRALDKDPTSSNDTLVRTSAEALCALFNSYASSLETLRQNTIADYKQQVSAVNEILTNIRNLNESIRECDVHGDNALEMRDERNRQIDELSQYMQIKVEYSMEDIGAGKQVEKLTISLGNANPDPNIDTDRTVLIDGNYGSQLSIKQIPVPNPDYDPNDAASLPFLDKDGNPCAEADADMMDSPNYEMIVSRLLDSKRRETPIEELQKRPVELHDNDLYGSLQAQRELLTEKGEFSTADDVARDPNATIKRGIPYYQKSMDLLAKKFAETYNNLNVGFVTDQNGDYLQEYTGTPKELGLRRDADGYFVDANGYYVGTADHKDIPCIFTQDPIKMDASDADKEAYAQAHGLNSWDEVLKLHGTRDEDTAVTLTPTDGEPGVKLGGVLFSNRGDNDDPTGITAANITVSHSWSTGDLHIIPKFQVLFDGDVEDTTQNVNIGHMISSIDEKLVYDPTDLDPDAVGKRLCTASFNDMYDNMNTVLGNDQRVTNVDLSSQYTSLVEIDTNRDGVSGVDLNDEAMNMMQFQKAYSAACRLMTAIDEALDRLINNTGIAGR
ncbi:MAG: flagellar basal body protein [Roseburia sp.]|nr:flagellar basal body protein [Roseburia sp.]